MKKQTVIGAFLVLMTAAGLGGCQKKQEEPWVPEETAIQVQEDGTLRETIVDRLSQPYYDPAELENMIRSSVDTYNHENGEGSVTVDEFTAEEDRITVRMTYLSSQEYSSFNQVPFFSGSMLEAEMEGFRFTEDFLKVDKGNAGSKAIAPEEPLSHKEYSVLIVDASYMAEVPGDIMYVSLNARPAGRRIMRPAGALAETAEETEAEGLELPSSAVYTPEGEEENGGNELICVIYDF
jgi:hypothetical protein